MDRRKTVILITGAISTLLIVALAVVNFNSETTIPTTTTTTATFNEAQCGSIQKEITSVAKALQKSLTQAVELEVAIDLIDRLAAAGRAAVTAMRSWIDACHEYDPETAARYEQYIKLIIPIIYELEAE